MTSLVKQIDQRLSTAGKTARPLGAYVLFVNNADGLDQRLRTMAQTAALQRVNLCIGAPPKNYEVAADADITVVIYSIGWRRDQRVTANFALRRGELDDANAYAIVQALAAVLPK